MTPARWIILADDLTGAAESAGLFARAGAAARLIVHADDRDRLKPRDAEHAVLAINTASRHLRPEAAARRVATLTRDALRLRPTGLYKKTDSALRGNIGAELAAVGRARPDRPVVYVPAAPSAERFVRGGVLFIGDRPVAESEFARDPLAPVRCSDVPAALRRQTGLAVSHVDLETLRRGRARIAADGVTVFDGEREADLQRVIKLIERSPAWPTLAGPAALLAALVPRLVPALQSAPPAAPRRVRSWLVVNGSRHPRSLAQIEHGLAGRFQPLDIDPWRTFCDDAAEREAAIEHLVEQAGATIAHATDAILRLSPDADRADAIARRRIRLALPDRLGEIVRRVYRRLNGDPPGPGPGLMLFGGESAERILLAAGVHRCDVLPGPHPALHRLQCHAPPLADATVLTKCGGFGPVELLEELTA